MEDMGSGIEVEDFNVPNPFSPGEPFQFRSRKRLSIYEQCDFHKMIDYGVLEGKEVNRQSDIEEMAPRNLFHDPDHRERALDFSFQSLEKGYALSLKDFLQAFPRTVNLEVTPDNEKQDDETTDEGEVTRADG